MTQVLYSLRSEIDASDNTRYRITKFVDGEVESSYYTTRLECECPAGQRPTCRHRQMLPQMLNADILNTHWFMDWDHGGAIVDFEGTTRAAYERAALAREAPPLQGELLTVPTADGWGAKDITPSRQTFTIPDGYEAVRDSDGRATGEIQPHSETVITEAFDASNGGSNPPAVANIDTSLVEDKPEDSFREFLHKEGKVPRHLHPQEVHTSKNPWRRL